MQKKTDSYKRYVYDMVRLGLQNKNLDTHNRNNFFHRNLHMAYVLFIFMSLCSIGQIYANYHKDVITAFWPPDMIPHPDIPLPENDDNRIVGIDH